MRHIAGHYQRWRMQSWIIYVRLVCDNHGAFSCKSCHDCSNFTSCTRMIIYTWLVHITRLHLCAYSVHRWNANSTMISMTMVISIMNPLWIIRAVMVRQETLSSTHCRSIGRRLLYHWYTLYVRCTPTAAPANGYVASLHAIAHHLVSAGGANQ